jgi:hypothetical protein
MSQVVENMAERVGFEPTLPFRVNTLSKRAPSATRPSLRQVAAADGKQEFGRADSRLAPPESRKKELLIHDLRHFPFDSMADGAEPQLAPPNTPTSVISSPTYIETEFAVVRFVEKIYARSGVLFGRGHR